MFWKFKKKFDLLPSRDDVLFAIKEKEKLNKKQHEKNLKQLHDMLIDTIKQNLNSNIFWRRNSFEINLQEWEKNNEVKDYYKGQYVDQIVEKIIPKLIKLGYSVDYENRNLFISIENREIESCS